MSAVMDYYRELGPEYEDVLCDMLVFDALICNVDQHFGNFGFLVDNETNQITAPASLFDCGHSLFNFAGTDCWESEAALSEDATTLMPSVYDDFIGTAKRVMQERHHQLRRMLNFHFKKHSRYNLPDQRLKLIERQIQMRAKALLE